MLGDSIRGHARQPACIEKRQEEWNGRHIVGANPERLHGFASIVLTCLFLSRLEYFDAEREAIELLTLAQAVSDVSSQPRFGDLALMAWGCRCMQHFRGFSHHELRLLLHVLVTLR